MHRCLIVYYLLILLGVYELFIHFVYENLYYYIAWHRIIQQLQLTLIISNFQDTHAMFNKILGKKDKGLDVFTIPDKKYCHDIKKLGKMEKKDLLDEIQSMEKYNSSICSKLEQAKKQHEKMVDRLEETSEKLNVVNSKMCMISNQHEQLQVKFTNLQNSLEMMTREKQLLFKAELEFIESKQLNKERVLDLPAVFRVYRDQINLVQKIAHQNKQLKQKYNQLEADYFSLSDKIAESKGKTNQQAGQTKTSGKSAEDTEPDDEKNGQLKLILQTKQQMIMLLNKKINEQEDKKNQMLQKMSDLNHQIQKQATQIKQKVQEIKRWQSEINQYKKKFASFKQIQQKSQKAFHNLKQDNKKKSDDIQKLNNQLIEISHRLKLNQEEKKILIGNTNQNILSSQQNQKQLQLQYQKFKHQIEAKERQIQKINKKLTEQQQQIKYLQNIINEYKIKQKEYEKIIEQLAEETNKNQQLNKQIQNLQENYQIKLRKLQFNFNQERIKADALKRSLTNSETKQQENRKKLDEMYEKKMAQDNKYAKMESKLKQYKQLCQYLQKQKIQLQKTFQTKIRNMEEIVINQQQEQQQQCKTQNSEPTEKNHSSRGDQALISKLNSRIVDLEEQISFLKQENASLLHKRDQLEESNLQLSKNYKMLNQKRQEVIKQINKIASVDYNSQIQKNKMDEKMGVGVRSRQRKIAEKALKALDILSKMLTSLYKQFINVHVIDINRKEIKNLEGNINALVGKCEDMKDIFQGYL